MKFYTFGTHSYQLDQLLGFCGMHPIALKKCNLLFNLWTLWPLSCYRTSTYVSEAQSMLSLLNISNHQYILPNHSCHMVTLASTLLCMWNWPMKKPVSTSYLFPKNTHSLLHSYHLSMNTPVCRNPVLMNAFMIKSTRASIITSYSISDRSMTNCYQ